MNNSDNISFEKALLELEQIVALLENGGLSLDESISSYEKAVKLAGICNKKLTEAEGRVRILTESEDGSITDKPFGSLPNE